jgi:hypothetical protein
MAAWLAVRPPRSAADAAARIAVGLGGAIALAPATRYGYLVYPAVLIASAMALREPADARTPLDQQAQADRLPEPAN